MAQRGGEEEKVRAKEDQKTKRKRAFYEEKRKRGATKKGRCGDVM